jgi:AmpD protein
MCGGGASFLESLWCALDLWHSLVMNAERLPDRHPAAIWHPSPNYDARPDGIGIELIVIHAISLPPCEFGGGFVTDFFLNRLDPARHPYFSEIAGMRVSAHLLIERDGQLRQFVPFQQRAWHAGQSSWRGRTRCNDFSLGIELEGCDTQAFTASQYVRLAEVVGWLQRYLGLPDELDRVVGHSDIAPSRKTDPGPCFDWLYLRSKPDWPFARREWQHED